jgi:cytochrome c peroxidase
MRTRRPRLGALALLLLSSTVFLAGGAVAQVPALSTVPVPRPSNIGAFISNEQAAVILGKALFWDMAVGSDGMACASCHFRAGADPRKKNQISPGLLRMVFETDEDGNRIAVSAADHNFDGQGPNYTLRREDFPFRTLADPTDRESAIAADTNNVTSSAGVVHQVYGEPGYYPQDPDGFYVGTGARRGNTRRVEPRNTPTMINAIFNHRNFWDMRANNLFNGQNPFGASDPDATLYKAVNAQSPQPVKVLIDNASLASQASGPPTNQTEMSADGRTFPDVGRSLMRELALRHRGLAQRLLTLRPLARQLVARDDSVLGPHSRAPFPGLNTTYEALIRTAFRREWWDSPKFIQVAEDGTTAVVDRRDTNTATDEFTLMQYNFALFFGLAVQLYEATLIADDTPFDRFLKDPVTNPLSLAADRGRRTFFNLDLSPAPRGGCLFCHRGPLLSEASVDEVAARGMVRRTGTQVSDTGARNIGIRETTDDIGVGGVDPFGHALSAAAGVLQDGEVFAADGTFKIPGLRNVELTAPYFHNGGEATLLDVVTFYSRGGNRGGATNPITTRDEGVVIGGLGLLNLSDAAKADLVEFMKALTDERVRKAAAPFDHPQLFVPNGHPGNTTFVIQVKGRAVDTMLEIPATGRNGGPVLPGFLE